MQRNQLFNQQYNQHFDRNFNHWANQTNNQHPTQLEISVLNPTQLKLKGIIIQQNRIAINTLYTSIILPLLYVRRRNNYNKSSEILFGTNY
jgi:hypothetical protein